jgi:hypothetical protein
VIIPSDLTCCLFLDLSLKKENTSESK